MSASENAPPPMPEFTSINVPNGGQVELVTIDKINPNAPVDVAERTLLDSTDPAKAVDAIANGEVEAPKPPDTPENTRVIDPSTGESVDTLSSGDYEKSNETKTKERFDNNLKTELQKAHNQTIQELQKEVSNNGNGQVELNEDGTPKDFAQMARYTEIYSNNSENARNEALRATVTQDYLDRHPKPNRTEDSKKFDEWAKGLRDELNATEEMKKEITELEKGAPKLESKSSNESTAAKEEKTNPESKVKDEASFMIAIQLAAQSLANIGDKEKSKIIADKINKINTDNPDLKPSFKARVTIAKTLIIGGFLRANFATHLMKDSAK